VYKFGINKPLFSKKLEIGITFGVALLQNLENMKAKAMRNLLIHNVKQVIKQPYADYAIGITDNENKFGKASGTGGLVVFNCRNDEWTLGAYNHFRLQGMFAHTPIGMRSKYLYIYRLDGEAISII